MRIPRKWSALAFAVAALGAGLFWVGIRPERASACITCTSSVSYAQMSVSDPTAISGSDTLDIWRNQSNGRTTYSWDGGSDSMVVTGNTITVVVDGNADSIDHYPNASDAWDRVAAEYNVTQTAVNSALANGQTVLSEPGDSTASADSLANQDGVGQTTYAEPYSNNFHYDASPSALQTSIGFSVPQLATLDGYGLIDAVKSQLYGPDTATSGWFAALEYASSSDPSNSTLTVNVAVPTGSANGWGDIYQSMVSSTPDLTGTGYAATLIGDGPGPNQALFRKGSAYIAVTATWTPTTTEWRAILSALATN